MPNLQQVIYRLPNNDRNFTNEFLKYVSPLGTTTENQINLQLSNTEFLPTTSIQFTNVHIPQVIFLFDDKSLFNVGLTNTTGINKTSPHKYTPITINDFTQRCSKIDLKYIDHTGFNLPYFDGIHPIILSLREKLKSTCLYHTFPKHLEDAPWDFILPATKDEISDNAETNYLSSRKPKIEIVSFDKSSVPLIQLDIQLDAKYEKLTELFPEAIHVNEIRNLWVYIQNDFGIDICFVLNEATYKDWGKEFSNSRLK